MSQPRYANTDSLDPFLDRLRAKEHLLLCVLADSNACNTNFTDGAKQWPELLHSRLRDAFDTQALLLLNSGISGDCVERALARFDTDVARFKPDLTVLCLGSNDANRLDNDVYARGMNQCLDQLEALGSLVLLRTPTTVMEYEPAPPHLWLGDTKLQEKVAIIRQLAAERALPFVDTYGLWQDLAAQPDWEMGPLMHDAVHTNAAGHQLVCEQILPAFGVATKEGE